jgi:PIF1-like helicase
MIMLSMLFIFSGRVDAQLEDWRQFTNDQLVHIDDYRNSPYWCDSASTFNVRPPELLVFDDLQVFCECFVTAGTRRSFFTQELCDQSWFDGLSRLVLLRSCSLSKAISFLTNKSASGDTRAQCLLDCVFQPIARHEMGYEERFVQHTDAQQVVSVISLVKPWDRTKFLAHLCLSLGRYRTEIDLFTNSNLRTAFVKAGLFPDNRDVTRDDVLFVLRKYIMQDLRFHPISARQFGKYAIAALTTLLDLLEDKVIHDYTPCVTNVMLKDQASDFLLRAEESRRVKMVSTLSEDPAVCNLIPDDLILATINKPLQWTPRIVPVDGISLETVAEQNAALQCCLSAIDTFLMPSCRGVKFPLLVGRPGSGKSFCLKLATAYAISKGLQVELMSFTSERARKLGGNHLHLVFPFGVAHGRMSFSHTFASVCLGKLRLDPVKEALIKRTDVFIFEEIGLLSAEYFSAIDNVLKVLMGNSAPMGGKLFISCGDSKQLPPIDGRPLWGSLNMCTMMEVFIFQCDVRARDDAILQRLNSDCRRSLTALECRTVAETVIRECRFEADWSSVPDEACRIVSTKAAELKVMEEFLSGRQTSCYRAVDEVQNGTVWECATQRVTQTLNRNVYEYELCKLYVGAVVRMTFNRRQDSSTVFSQGQLAVVMELPDESAEFTRQRLRLRLAPPGMITICII